MLPGLRFSVGSVRVFSVGCVCFCSSVRITSLLFDTHGITDASAGRSSYTSRLTVTPEHLCFSLLPSFSPLLSFHHPSNIVFCLLWICTERFVPKNQKKRLTQKCHDSLTFSFQTRTSLFFPQKEILWRILKLQNRPQTCIKASYMQSIWIMRIMWSFMWGTDLRLRRYLLQIEA